MNYLFSTNYLNDYWSDNNLITKKAISSITLHEFQTKGIHEVSKTVINDHKIKIPQLLEDKVVINKPEDLGSNLTKYTFNLPFEGNSDIFLIKPEKYYLNPPLGIIKENVIQYTYKAKSTDTSEAIRQAFDYNVSLIKEYLSSLDESFKKYHLEVDPAVEILIQDRYDKLKRDDDTANSLGFPIK